jgi:hypothetical protein
MRNEASRIDHEAWKFAEKPTLPLGPGSLVRVGLFIVATGVGGIIAFVALLHVAEVIP